MKSVEDICRFIGADSLGYLSLQSVFRAVDDRKQYCSACFTDRYPTEVAPEEKQKSLFDREED
jgi:amidophosphoribosyltransferase